jgi:hypothetical protein
MPSNDTESGRENAGGEDATRGVGLTTGMHAVEALTNEELLSGTRRLVCQSNRVLAALLAHLAEVEARGLHRTRACATLYTYCIYELRMSEDAAYRRVGAARLVKRFPVLFGAIERGELHLTALLLLGPYLTDANVAEVVARAKFRTKKEVVKLVRLLSPLPDVPSRIEPLGLEGHRPAPRATWSNLMAARCPVRELQPDERPGNWLPPTAGDESVAVDRNDSTTTESDLATLAQDASTTPAGLFEQPAPAPARSEGTGTNLDGPQRFKVQFTATEEYVALVEEAKALLAHALPRADLAEIHLRAIRTLVAELKKRKFATSTKRTLEKAATELPDSVPSAHVAASSRAEAVASIEARPLPPFVPAERRQRDSDLPRRRDAEPPRQRDLEPPQQRDSEAPRVRDRYLPAAVRRAVFERDGNRCAYVDERGERCREISRLEFHHHEAFAHGGPATLDNLSLYCAAHNALAAEQDFGRDFARTKRDGQSHLAERSVSAVVRRSLRRNADRTEPPI